MKREAPTNDDKAFVDVASFQEFLSAAYVVQQHNDRQQGKKESGSNHSQALAAMVEAEEQIRTQQLGLADAARLIAQRAQEVCHADGVAVGIVDKDELAYYAATGSAAGEAGERVALAASLSAECLQSGQILQASEAEKDPRLPMGFCREHGIRALVAAPATRQGKVVGVVELRFVASQHFEEETLRSCQLWADLVAEAKARSNGLPQKRAPFPGSAAMLETLDRLRPQLSRLEEKSRRRETGFPGGAQGEPAMPPDQQDDPPAYEPASESSRESDICRGCGHPLEREDQFCGLCGTQRTSQRPLQSTWSSLWDLQRKAEKSGKPLSSGAKDADSLDLLPSELERLVQELAGAPPAKPEPSAQEKHETSLPSFAPLPYHTQPSAEGAESPALAEEADGDAVVDTAAEETPKSSPEFFAWKPESPADLDVRFPFASGRVSETVAEPAASAPPEDSQPAAETAAHAPAASGAAAPAHGQWTSATKAHAWLDSLQNKPTGKAWLLKQWQTQRANIYLGAATALLIAVLLGWGAPDAPAPAPAPTRARQALPQAPQLSFFEKTLVELGLAEAPPAPVYQGNPSAKVWIDTHTALYYCAGSEQYGRTPGGKFVLQREAQMDAFQPAARRPCD